MTPVYELDARLTPTYACSPLRCYLLFYRGTCTCGRTRDVLIARLDSSVIVVASCGFYLRLWLCWQLCQVSALPPSPGEYIPKHPLWQLWWGPRAPGLHPLPVILNHEFVRDLLHKPGNLLLHNRINFFRVLQHLQVCQAHSSSLVWDTDTGYLGCRSLLHCLVYSPYLFITIYWLN